MVRDELIQALGEETGDGPDRKKFEITTAGQNKVREWLFTPDVPSESLQSNSLPKRLCFLTMMRTGCSTSNAANKWTACAN
jgi:DNA-binding PadR family transcriptional regulator